MTIEKQAYLNNDARKMFHDRMDSDAKREWAWQALAGIKERFPSADHWTTGGVDNRYIDIRIGSKRQGKAKGLPGMYLHIQRGSPALSLHADYPDPDGNRYGTDFTECPSKDALSAWLDGAQTLLGDSHPLSKGSGLVPRDFESETRDDIGTPEHIGVDSQTQDSGPQNIILFGPPGTGKTHRTVEEALRILDPVLLKAPTSREEQTKAFNNYLESGQVVFTTFHQSFSYEDFVEGLRATTSDGQIEYVVEPGVFKKLCERAGQGVVASEDAFDIAVATFMQKLEESDGRVGMQTATGKRFSVTYGGGTLFRAYPERGQHQETGHPTNMDHVRQLFQTGDETNIYRPSYVKGMLAYLKRECGLPDAPQVPTSSHDRKPFVLIIDEINRGNVSRIFGELITLIEPSRRAGGPESLSVTLPYSKKSFQVPQNLHLVATMNTADRSLAGLDIAMRRRFSFIEMSPDTSLLDGVLVDGIDIGELLSVINERIELLLDRDHAIGHAYLLPLKDERKLSILAGIFRNKILPLLQEYFFEDWERIQWVLNDHRKATQDRFLIKPILNVAKLFGPSVPINEQAVRWTINSNAFQRVSAYTGIINVENGLTA